ncbi:amidohydrolase [Bradyrhizobium nitroreducens]|uniref:Amidohydrolase n=1 Tax=Bradyrhizobium nitroreducens TaxID=709803 RepID=A0A2M6U8I1_9BRAD|nr:M20 aminoacylase family protein [Bradyrhizobium nitroreducens]PIT00811.1 amidohydrolase [Bradyrhizobium nitroreducens]
MNTSAIGIDAQVAESLDEFVAIRRDLHRHPELAFREHRTSAIIAQRLADYGYEVTRGMAETGVVGVLRKGGGERKLALRADIDALPISERTGLDYASQNAGVMHACGHDGHTVILLAAAKALSRLEFSGVLTLIFQPAEEIGAGAHKLLSEGLFDRFPVDAIFGLHNWPGETLGHFGFVAGPAMAAIDRAIVRIIGRGGHGASPHEVIDPIVAASSVVLALQSIVSRNIDPREAAVVSVGSIQGGEASNVIPDAVELKLTIRSFNPKVRERLEERIRELVSSQAESYGAKAEIEYTRGFPAVVNHPTETALVHDIALAKFGKECVASDFSARMASEDFAHYLMARPGSFVFAGNGDSAPLHNAAYNFNDALIAPAASLWVHLARSFLS